MIVRAGVDSARTTVHLSRHVRRRCAQPGEDHLIRHWSRTRFIAFSAVVGVVAFFVSVAISDVARRRSNERETGRELVLSATSVHDGVAVYDSRADAAVVALDADVARLRRWELGLMLGVGALAVGWAGVARAWLAGRRTRSTT